LLTAAERNAARAPLDLSGVLCQSCGHEKLAEWCSVALGVASV
jgi:hypothetical protein